MKYYNLKLVFIVLIIVCMYSPIFGKQINITLPKKSFTVYNLVITIPEQGKTYELGVSPVRTGNITCQAKAVDKNSTEITVPFTTHWDLRVTWDASGVTYFKAQSSKNNPFTTVFDMGGELAIGVSAAEGQESISQVNIHIHGTNPSKSETSSYLATDIIRAIAWLESNWTWSQFDSNKMPINESGDYGIMRINWYSWNSDFDWRNVGWNWMSDIDAGKSIYNGYLSKAQKFNTDHPGIVYNNIDDYGRSDAADHVERDALSRYNTGQQLYDTNGNIINGDGKTYAMRVENFKYTKPW